MYLDTSHFYEILLSGWNNTLGFPVAETYQPTCKDCAEPSAKYVYFCRSLLGCSDFSQCSMMI